ncbi:hypothetical protein MTBUT4_250032 [Magnetospirillum sp. UT-4]|nr:hypothetical protein MTBUT4_250032 [Magnetospirillum sp. UT-4]
MSAALPPPAGMVPYPGVNRNAQSCKLRPK